MNTRDFELWAEASLTRDARLAATLPRPPAGPQLPREHETHAAALSRALSAPEPAGRR